LHHFASLGWPIGIDVLRELVLQYNANMFAVDSDGKTPFDALKGNANVVDTLLEMYCSVLTRDPGRLALHVLLRVTEYSFHEDEFFHPPRNPLQIHLPLGKLTLKHWRTLLHILDTELIHSRDDRGKLPIHIACQTKAPVEVLAMLVELDPTTLQLADGSGNLPLHECCRGIVNYSSVRYLLEQGGVGTLAARNRQGALPLHLLCGSQDPSWQTVKYMVQSFPASMEARTNTGRYPFMIAACESSTASLSVVYELARAIPDLVVSN
jgi:ankyrin repeat protein